MDPERGVSWPPSRRRLLPCRPPRASRPALSRSGQPACPRTTRAAPASTPHGTKTSGDPRGRSRHHCKSPRRFSHHHSPRDSPSRTSGTSAPRQKSAAFPTRFQCRSVRFESPFRRPSAPELPARARPALPAGGPKSASRGHRRSRGHRLRGWPCGKGRGQPQLRITRSRRGGHCGRAHMDLPSRGGQRPARRNHRGGPRRLPPQVSGAGRSRSGRARCRRGSFTRLYRLPSDLCAAVPPAHFILISPPSFPAPLALRNPSAVHTALDAASPRSSIPCRRPKAVAEVLMAPP